MIQDSKKNDKLWFTKIKKDGKIGASHTRPLKRFISWEFLIRGLILLTSKGGGPRTKDLLPFPQVRRGSIGDHRTKTFRARSYIWSHPPKVEIPNAQITGFSGNAFSGGLQGVFFWKEICRNSSSRALIYKNSMKYYYFMHWSVDNFIYMIAHAHKNKGLGSSNMNILVHIINVLL